LRERGRANDPTEVSRVGEGPARSGAGAEKAPGAEAAASRTGGRQKFAIEPKKLPGHAELTKKLAESVQFQGIDDPKETLAEALQQLESTCKVRIEIDVNAFKAVGMEDVAATEIAGQKPIDKMPGAPLDEVLAAVLDRVKVAGGTRYRLGKERVVITTWHRIPVSVETSADRCTLREVLDYIEDHYRLKFDTSAVRDKEKTPVNLRAWDESHLGDVVDRVLREADAESGAAEESKVPVVPRGSKPPG
jgi:hypothetical protein